MYDNKKVYVSAYTETSNGWRTQLWINNILQKIEQPTTTTFSNATDMKIFYGNSFIVGYKTNNGTKTATLWQNRTEHDLANGSNFFFPNGLFIQEK